MNNRPKTEIISPPGAAQRTPADLDDMPTAVHRVVVGRLSIVEGPGTGARFDLFNGSHSIGRDPKCHIALDFGDPTVHRTDHAFIAHVDGGFEIHDNGKPNPVAVNDKPLSGRQKLRSGDRITIGRTVLKIDPA